MNRRRWEVDEHKVANYASYWFELCKNKDFNSLGNFELNEFVNVDDLMPCTFLVLFQ